MGSPLAKTRGEALDQGQVTLGRGWPRRGDLNDENPRMRRGVGEKAKDSAEGSVDLSGPVALVIASVDNTDPETLDEPVQRSQKARTEIVEVLAEGGLGKTSRANHQLDGEGVVAVFGGDLGGRGDQEVALPICARRGVPAEIAPGGLLGEIAGHGRCSLRMTRSFCQAQYMPKPVRDYRAEDVGRVKGSQAHLSRPGRETWRYRA